MRSPGSANPFTSAALRTATDGEGAWRSAGALAAPEARTPFYRIIDFLRKKKKLQKKNIEKIYRLDPFAFMREKSLHTASHTGKYGGEEKRKRGEGPSSSNTAMDGASSFIRHTRQWAEGETGAIARCVCPKVYTGRPLNMPPMNV